MKYKTIKIDAGMYILNMTFKSGFKNVIWVFTQVEQKPSLAAPLEHCV